MGAGLRRPLHVIIEGAGHFVQSDAPEELRRRSATGGSRPAGDAHPWLAGTSSVNTKSVVVAYDVHLADRVRRLLVDGSPVTEQKMFGGLAFLVAGKMAVAASGQGGLLVQVDSVRADRLLATPTRGRWR